MPSLIHESLEVITTLPTEADHLVPAIGAAVVTAGVAARDWIRFGKTEEQRYTEVSNPQIAESIEEEVPQDVESIRRKRLVPTTMVKAGLGLLAVAAIGGFHGESSQAQSDANTVVVEDVSASMRHTHDLGNKHTSRLDAASKAVVKADYSGKLGFVQAGETSETTMNLTHKWRGNQTLTKPEVGENADAINPAIELGASLLPKDKKGDSDGTLVVISDATVSDSDKTFKKTADALKKHHVDTQIVVPGTSSGRYRTKPNMPWTKSEADASKFDAFGKGHVTEATSASEVRKAVQDTIHEAGVSHKEKNSYWIALIGFGMAAVGAGKQAKRLREMYN